MSASIAPRCAVQSPTAYQERNPMKLLAVGKAQGKEETYR